MESRWFPPYKYSGQDLAFWRTPVYAKLQTFKCNSDTACYKSSPGLRKIYLADAYGGRFYFHSTMGGGGVNDSVDYQKVYQTLSTS